MKKTLEPESSLIYPQDEEVALSALREDASLASRFADPRRELASLHADFGDRCFRLILGLSAPRNAAESLIEKLWKGQITGEDYAVERAAIDKAPLTVELVDCLEIEFTDVLRHYSELLKTLQHIPEYLRQGKRLDGLERDVSYRVRELFREKSLSRAQQMEAINLAVERRTVASQPILQHPMQNPRFSGACGQLLFGRVIGQIRDGWEACVKHVRIQAQDYPRRLLSEIHPTALEWLFRTMCDERGNLCLPAPNLLLDHITQDLWIVRSVLRKRTEASSEHQPAAASRTILAKNDLPSREEHLAGYTGAEPAGDVHKSSVDNADVPLSERAQLVLIAMSEMGLVDSDRRQSTEEIAAKALGSSTDANSVKNVMLELKALQMIDSKTGRGGGCWLTKKGRGRAEKLRNQ